MRVNKQITKILYEFRTIAFGKMREEKLSCKIMQSSYTNFEGMLQNCKVLSRDLSRNYWDLDYIKDGGKMLSHENAFY